MMNKIIRRKKMKITRKKKTKALKLINTTISTERMKRSRRMKKRKTAKKKTK